MRDTTYRQRSFASRSRYYRRRSRFPRVVFLVLAFGIAALIGIVVRDNSQAPRESAVRELTPVLAPPKVVASAGRYDPLLDPGYSLGHAPRPLNEAAPLGAGFQSASPAPAAPVEQFAAAAEEPDSAPSLPLPALEPAARLAQGAPVPVPRPSDLTPPASPEAPRVAERPLSRRTRTAAAPAAQAEDNRSFFEKLFGVQRSSGPALAYAAPEDDVVDRSRGRKLSPTLPSSAAPVSAQATAIYDISAKTVYMPNGDRLEAHSGLGDKMDDPRFAHVRMQGVTPPHVYDLTEREALFHGVRALRLNPVGGSGKIHGRAGLLTHTYLLGPRGDSNGCVSFRDYDKFLQAYLRGEVKRLVVVASL
ncbi:DUF2778 domain-containing protein [Bosea caraganae]|uniref:DUF2778 domain-containing protein n=1 Tax=Bosea caraganae TaxID=2763117 RepID=A0A370L2S0_9HYPH|nr:DUF2778 domain-containing protein [Bosea caraganae]RDJ21468.1 DUF2778 domain-containing protein [Bosea caraganae]RDJ23436.1 DUF2778 domain-containing protein [Bosea caraganae]